MEGREVRDAARATAAPEFRPNEYFETLLRIWRDQPRRYKSEVSLGLQKRVELYERAKLVHARKAAA